MYQGLFEGHMWQQHLFRKSKNIIFQNFRVRLEICEDVENGTRTLHVASESGAGCSPKSANCMIP